MANPYQLAVGRNVHWLHKTPGPPEGPLKWSLARVATIDGIDPTQVTLKLSDGTSLNAGALVPLSTRAAGETNVWRPY